ncbi:hypothetical protein ElyMa_006616100 [Elysia marginata]|uniref:Uncharacterized protein n=1 Tax=Elysia marginata TaxID=1093978 RepID=A0AAV4IKH7_9GAST|nr:hypothetical protein ElyMa_006616100 [Elysia marginata]
MWYLTKSCDCLGAKNLFYLKDTVLFLFYIRSIGSDDVQQQEAESTGEISADTQPKQTYALELLELDRRIIKVRFKKLKEVVSKIKSLLPVDDIAASATLTFQAS